MGRIGDNMESKMVKEQSSLSFQTFYNSGKENNNLIIDEPQNDKRQHRDEYDYMDGVLGCVKV